MQHSVMTPRAARSVTGKQSIGIRELLEWAFQREAAQLDFDEIEWETGARAYGMEWIMIQQARLGCRVDGGGRSHPHHDADQVAAALACLPEVYGGRRMAVQIAELARAGQVPDWMGEAELKCEPVDVRRTKHGVYAMREYCRDIGSRWPADQIPGRDDGYVCPVSYSGNAAQVGAARRRYLAWYGALLELRNNLQTACHLTAFELTDRMPEREPWRNGLTRMSLC